MPVPNDYLKLPGAAPGLKTPDGIEPSVERIGNQNDLIVSQLHGKMYEQSLRLNMFFAANQAATTTTIALATTYTGFCLSNPAGNTKNVVPRQVAIMETTAPGALSGFAIAGGYAVAGVVTHTTPLTPYSTVLGNGQTATAKADAAATLVGTPLVILPLTGVDDAADIQRHGPTIVDLQGSIIIPPGGYVFVYTLTVHTGMFAGMTWEEVPV